MIWQPTRKAFSSKWFDRYARFGYTAKGLVWGLVGLLAIRVAIGDWGEQADFYGALAEIGEQPLNALLLIVLSVALFGYAGWRIIQAVADVEGEGNDPAGLAKRLLYLSVGLMYGFLAVYAAGILAGWSTEDDEIRDLTAMALGWPMGEWIVGTVGVLVVVMGVAELYVVVSRRFEVELGEDRFGRWERLSLMAAGGLGHTARGAIYIAAGVFAVRAALDYDPDEARGLADTFRELADQPFGSAIVLAIAVGFIAFGIYCVLLAFHRHIPNESVFRGRGSDGRQEEGKRADADEPDGDDGDAPDDGRATEPRRGEEKRRTGVQPRSAEATSKRRRRDARTSD